MSEHAQAVAELARLIERVSGNVVAPGHHPFLAQAAAARVRATGQSSLAAYVRALALGMLAGEWGSLLPLVTVNESYFFRTPQHFTALADRLLPALLARRATCRRLRVWSAGCARGEEPATIALLLAEHRGLAGWDWRIHATDVDEEALAAARRGLYGPRAVAGVPQLLLARHFTRDGDLFALASEVRSRIDYLSLNLVQDPLPAREPAYDLVFLRNVLIYFAPALQRRVAAAVGATLAEDGYLFVGPAETLWQICDELEPVDLGDCFCYRKKPATTAQGPRDRGPGTAKPDAERAGRDQPGARQRAGRPTGLNRPAMTAPPPRLGAPPAGALGPVPGSRSAASGTSSSTTPPGSEVSAAGGVVSPDAPSFACAPTSTRERILAAAHHLAANRVAEATELVTLALRADPADAEAHGLDALIHDLAGRTEAAIVAYRAALYLDPSLFQVRLLLADALRRAGWETRARHEYRQVLAELASGRPRALPASAPLHLPGHEQAARRCRDALQRG